MVVLPSIKIDSSALLAKYFMPHQANWIMAEEPLHARHERAFILAEKSIRIGWTFCDAFKNVRKRLRFPRRDYLFVTKDYPSALEYSLQAYRFADFLDFTSAIVSHGEDYLKVNRLDAQGKPTAFTDEIKIGYLKFDNGSRIIAFSSNPYAMAVYGGDVGLDEFAKHSNAKLLWEIAQGRVTWAGDLAVWSSHDGQDTLFNQFAQQARAGAKPWNLYYRVTMPDAIELGLLDVLNRTQNTRFTPQEFLADCKARAGSEEVYEQAYLCNPMGATANRIVEYSAIEQCRYDYEIVRLHLEQDQILQQFGPFRPDRQDDREHEIKQFICRKFTSIFQSSATYRLGFDVAASGQGDLAVIYIDERQGSELWLRALFSCRTEDWNFLYTVLSCFLREIKRLKAAGDQSGLGRQICWDASQYFRGRFTPVNFSAKKHDLGFALMNQLATVQKRFPRSEQDIAADYFALRKAYQGGRWVFSEGPNSLNPASHCDIAWAGGLATEAHLANRCEVGALVC
jgi:phage FluMu gp28-like protein